MSHVVLLGDSIFDNAAYVPSQPDVIEQVRSKLPEGWKATLIALDGSTTLDVFAQIEIIPADTTHLVLSVGGNDAIGASSMLYHSCNNVGEGFGVLTEVAEKFRNIYVGLLCQLLSLEKPLVVCTIYDMIPKLGLAERAGLMAFNDVITRAAFAAGAPLIDLRLVCDQPDDYSKLSPIEPSVVGGEKIAGAIVDTITGHDFAKGRSTVWI